MNRLFIFLSVLFVSALTIGGFADVVPKSIQRCKLSDPLLTECLTKSMQDFLPLLVKGVPEMELPGIEPLAIQDIHNGDPILNFKFTNNRFFGSTSSKIEELKIDQKKRKITMKYICSGRMDSDYTADGRLIILPIVGNGKSHITMTAVKYVYKMYYDVIKGEDGKEHWKINSNNYKVTYTPEHVKFELTNLFNGNKQLSDTVLRFASENWKEIFGLLGKAPMKAATDTVVGHITKLFLKVPVEDLFLPE